MLSDPEKYFAYTQCIGCTARACRHLLYGAYREGEYFFVNRRDFGYGECPLTPESMTHVVDYLQTIPEYKLIDHCTDICSELSQVEYNSYRQNHFIKFYHDTGGRIEFICNLIDRDIITAVGLPFGYEYDEKLRKWFSFFKGGEESVAGEVYHEEDYSAPAATDELIDEKKHEYSISNPRWEHVDETKRSKSPDRAKPGDEVRLMVTIEGVPDGAGVDFTVYNSASGEPKVIGQVHGRNEQGEGMVSWVVDFPDDEKDSGDDNMEMNLEFEAEVRDKVSDRSKIKLCCQNFEFSY
ncbi:hypothetical protein QA601_18185 [Chitinispirillales bacterium ANBcel5]|uniref:hypothetical protein n=1 Tax=Cellulosispirillum alkaliphilum TaxID=3039283 RepID=UPI002A4F4C4E|nr:hypothetical protein [Chitinispirillales bacterium ANBcel5]